MAGRGGWTIFSSGNEVNDLLLDGNIVWAATQDGVVRWDTEAGTNLKFTVLDGLPGNYVSSVSRDKSGQLWVLTSDGPALFDG